jgi:hypothetical protein
MRLHDRRVAGGLRRRRHGCQQLLADATGFAPARSRSGRPKPRWSCLRNANGEFHADHALGIELQLDRAFLQLDELLYNVWERSGSDAG